MFTSTIPSIAQQAAIMINLTPAVPLMLPAPRVAGLLPPPCHSRDLLLRFLVENSGFGYSIHQNEHDPRLFHLGDPRWTPIRVQLHALGVTIRKPDIGERLLRFDPPLSLLEFHALVYKAQRLRADLEWRRFGADLARLLDALPGVLSVRPPRPDQDILATITVLHDGAPAVQVSITPDHLRLADLATPARAQDYAVPPRAHQGRYAVCPAVDDALVAAYHRRRDRARFLRALAATLAQYAGEPLAVWPDPRAARLFTVQRPGSLALFVCRDTGDLVTLDAPTPLSGSHAPAWSHVFRFNTPSPVWLRQTLEQHVCQHNAAVATVETVSV